MINEIKNVHRLALKRETNVLHIRKQYICIIHMHKSHTLLHTCMVYIQKTSPHNSYLCVYFNGNKAFNRAWKVYIIHIHVDGASHT